MQSSNDFIILDDAPVRSRFSWFCSNDNCQSSNKCARNMKNVIGARWNTVNVKLEDGYDRCTDYAE
jgi:hypothetical protein